MSDALIQRYQVGGDIYKKIVAQHGLNVANAAAAAALTGDETEVNAALSDAEFGGPLNDSTASIFTDEIISHPFDAPAEAASGWVQNQIKDVLGNVVKKPLTLALLLAIAAGAFLWLGGARLIRPAA